MWQLSRPVVKAADFNFSDSDAARVDITQLWQDDVRLINALGRVNWYDADANFQFELCETCGYARCQPQGWVSVRRLGEIVVIVPAFTAIADAADYLRQEYLPPAYLWGEGIWLEQADYQNLRTLAPFPALDQLPGLTSWEAAKLLQWEAPHQILGDIHSQPKLPAELVIASSEGSFLEQVPVLTALMTQFLDAGDGVTLRSVKPEEQVIAFYLDLAGIPNWHALVYDGGNYKLYLAPGYVLESAYSFNF